MKHRQKVRIKMTCKECIHKSVCYRVDSVPIAYAQKCGDFVSGKALEQEPKWIPVSDRLPEAGEYVGNVAKYYLVQNEYGDMLVARYTHSGYWEQIYQLKPIGDEIVAWMPLPEPYKAQGRSE